MSFDQNLCRTNLKYFHYFCFEDSFPLDCVDRVDVPEVTEVTLALGEPKGDLAGSNSGSR